MNRRGLGEGRARRGGSSQEEDEERRDASSTTTTTTTLNKGIRPVADINLA